MAVLITSSTPPPPPSLSPSLPPSLPPSSTASAPSPDLTPPTASVEATASIPSPNVASATNVKLKRFSYTPAWDLLMLKAVSVSGAHLAQHGQTTALFEEALKLFLSAAPPGSLDVFVAPSSKSIRDRFKKICTDRRQENTANEGASGIVEVRGERELLLDDLLHASDEQDEEKRAERDEKAEKEKRLVEAGERTPAQALNRQSCSASNDVVVVEDGQSSKDDRPTPSKRKKPRVLSDEDEEDKQLLLDDMKARREDGSKGLKLEESRLEMERARDERQVARDEKPNEIEERKLVLAERKANIELEERPEALRERKSMIDVLSLLGNKLQ